MHLYRVAPRAFFAKSGQEHRELREHSTSRRWHVRPRVVSKGLEASALQCLQSTACVSDVCFGLDTR